MIYLIDENDPALLEFVDCFFQGSSLVDIHGAGDHGYGGTRWQVPAHAEERKKVYEKSLKEFKKMFALDKNLVKPLSKIISWNGKIVLDFGCGTGGLSVPLSEKGAKVFAADPVLLNLHALRCRTTYLGLDDDTIQTVQVDCKPPLPFMNETFHALICNSVIEFIPFHRPLYVKEFLRVLKVGGFLIISGENGMFPRNYYTKMWFPRFRRSEAIQKNQPFGTTHGELQRWIRESVYRVEDLSTRNYFNSFDKLSDRIIQPKVSSIVRALNTVFKACCRLIQVPSDIFLPYSTFIFQKCR